MKYRNLFLLVVGFFAISIFNSKLNAQDIVKEQIVLIKTEFGVMKAKLYNETPLHRDNFLKLVEDGFYNDLIFHRVIKGFMLQGGDPDSRGAGSDKQLGGGGPDYQIPSEINVNYFHKKGALCAARQGDNVNPEKKSSGSQFYVVQGNVWKNDMLQQFEEKQKFQALRNEAMKTYKTRQNEIQRLKTEGKIDSVNAIITEIQQNAEQNLDSTLFKMSQDRREIYTTIGGTPHLDGAYTVFGEVFEGLNIIDSIANVQTATGDRPLKDIKMTIQVVR